jgi:hypothetical protein
MSALVSDRQRYIHESPSIEIPGAIIVSGDIIQGVPLGTKNSATCLAKQYDTASDFIKELTDRFVDGDRSKVVIVPGNHDIDWEMSRSAMKVVPANQRPGDLITELCRADTLYRWDWKTCKLFQISNEAIYNQRMDAYWQFFDKFYEGVPRRLPAIGAGQAVNLYSLCDDRIGLAAFNSCHGNDCFAFHGSIPREVVAQAHLALTDASCFELLIAVWHHNIEGTPNQTDYMDVDIVRGMIGRGFRLGLYGHQHRTEAAPVQINLSNRETMAVVSAGSLCAGARELPLGAQRGYNIIEIQDDMRKARVHVREMSVANLFCASRRTAFGGNSWIDMDWDPPDDLAGRFVDSAKRRTEDIVAKAEIDLKANRPFYAKKLLLPLGVELPDYGRKLLIEAVRQTNDKELLLQLLTPPRTIAELIESMDLFLLRKDFPAAHHCLDAFGSTLEVAEPQMRELRARLAAVEAMTS